MGRLTGLAQGVLVCGPEVILYTPGKRLTVWEHRLLQTPNQVQREAPEIEGNVVAAGAAASLDTV